LTESDAVTLALLPALTVPVTLTVSLRVVLVSTVVRTN